MTILKKIMVEMTAWKEWGVINNTIEANLKKCGIQSVSRLFTY